MFGGFIFSLFIGFFLAGCAHNPDIRMGPDNTSGTTVNNPSSYLGCVQGELPKHTKVYTQQENNTLQLFVDSTDPNKAAGLVEIKDNGSQHHYVAYQRDAWYDHGRLLDAALTCSRA
ncbi:hypothetical protein [Pseudomonas sp. H9]|uniref:hypothetical protein n=1 Tax=Pseudomonas sp. H9 TaxID=483968 RepID=UPI001057E2FA|nr:hypothetical protein [Pseudomonas sp. H9]TDF80859.1 hypothetical protein E1573_19185 [Pseudomonas sp. H9]